STRARTGHRDVVIAGSGDIRGQDGRGELHGADERGGASDPIEVDRRASDEVNRGGVGHVISDRVRPRVVVIAARRAVIKGRVADAQIKLGRAERNVKGLGRASAVAGEAVTDEEHLVEQWRKRGERRTDAGRRKVERRWRRSRRPARGDEHAHQISRSWSRHSRDTSRAGVGGRGYGSSSSVRIVQSTAIERDASFRRSAAAGERSPNAGEG